MMKYCLFAVFVVLMTSCHSREESAWIRINQVGYMPDAVKNAVYVSNSDGGITEFSIFSADGDEKVYESEQVTKFPEWGPFQKSYRLNFSDWKEPGQYYIQVGEVKSPVFQIGNDVYAHMADYILQYMRQQQCGYNPFYKDSCHVKDGFIIYNPDKKIDSTHIDVIGGWHDATDYLQYVTTSANATYQMLFAYQQNPSVYGDHYKANGDPGSNGIPDILDQAKWGLDWLDKMNPSEGQMYNQIADDRDHIGFKLPDKDTADYGRGKGGERPVYFCTGKPQGSTAHQNNATGIASTAGKYASAFALGSKLLKKYYPEFSEKIFKKASAAYDFGKKNPGVCQTACYVSPYFYEEGNWVDDMELAAAQLYLLTKNNTYLEDAISYGKQEPFTPWMGADTARHYQWYPFINLGHYYLAYGTGDKEASLFDHYYQQGIQRVFNKGKNNPFFIGIPFIWCSNNLVVAMATQCNLYRTATGDDQYQEMEQSLIDWLFGCNPWGTSMVIGIPGNGDFPTHTHSGAVVLLNRQPLGGLVDGPIYRSIFEQHIGSGLSGEDPYRAFQSSVAVYHDDTGDYSTNEPTMDGTASLSYLLSALESEGKKENRD